MSNKIDFRFILVEARFPQLYKEAKGKKDGDVALKDIMADWLTRLTLYECGAMSASSPAQDTAPVPDDNLDFAKDVMDNL